MIIITAQRNDQTVQIEFPCNDERDMPRGLRGAVVGVDDQPALLMQWDNSSLSILLGEDSFRKLTPEEIEAENQKAEENEDIDSSPTLGM